MQVSHVISDSFLTLTCILVLYQCWKLHGHPLISVWGLFFGSVGLAAFFGVLRFADVHPSMLAISLSFQKISSTLGSCGLVAGVCWLFKRYSPVPLLVWTTIAGAGCFLAGTFIDKSSYYSILQLIAMISVLGLAVVYWIRPRLPEHRLIAQRLMLAIVLSALATISLQTLSRDLAIDAFHYLLGAGVLCFGWAARAGADKHHLRRYES